MSEGCGYILSMKTNHARRLRTFCLQVIANLCIFGSCIVHGKLSAVRCNDDEQISNTLFLNSLEEIFFCIPHRSEQYWLIWLQVDMDRLKRLLDVLTRESSQDFVLVVPPCGLLNLLSFGVMLHYVL